MLTPTGEGLLCVDTDTNHVHQGLVLHSSCVPETVDIKVWCKPKYSGQKKVNANKPAKGHQTKNDMV